MQPAARDRPAVSGSLPPAAPKRTRQEKLEGVVEAYIRNFPVALIPPNQIAQLANLASRKFTTKNPDIKNINTAITLAAARLGNIPLLEKMMRDYPNRKEELGSQVCEEAAEAGQLDLLIWARAREYPWNEYAATRAASAGHMHIIDWIILNGGNVNVHRILDAAAAGGHLKIVQWANANGASLNEETGVRAARGGHQNVLEWLHLNNCLLNERTCTQAAAGGHLGVVQWLRSKNCLWSKEASREAAGGGHQVLLEWALEDGCPFDESTCTWAAMGGHLETLKYLRVVKKCPWNQDTCSAAAAYGHLHVVKWAHDNGCPLDRETCNNAQRNGHLELLQWALDKGCPWDEQSPFKESQKITIIDTEPYPVSRGSKLPSKIS